MKVLYFNNTNNEKNLIEPNQGFGISDKWFNFAYKNGVQTTTTTSNNNMRFSLIKLKRKYTFKTIAINVAGSNAAGRFMKIGLYTNNYNKPENLIQDLGVIELLTIGEVSAPITGNITLNPGLYWIGGVLNGTSSISCAASTTYADSLGGSAVASHYGGYQMSQTYIASLPTTTSGLTTASSAVSFYLQTV